MQLFRERISRCNSLLAISPIDFNWVDLNATSYTLCTINIFLLVPDDDWWRNYVSIVVTAVHIIRIFCGEKCCFMMLILIESNSSFTCLCNRSIKTFKWPFILGNDSKLPNWYSFWVMTLYFQDQLHISSSTFPVQIIY